MSAILYHWFSNIDAKTASFQDKKSKKLSVQSISESAALKHQTETNWKIIPIWKGILNFPYAYRLRYTQTLNQVLQTLTLDLDLNSM